ncbi:MAG: hypothetical protein HY904_20770 [Deltaproteobacteria bacterium]|nr:hypothetical protein [Deltaproteobacteria bacterium]
MDIGGAIRNAMSGGLSGKVESFLQHAASAVNNGLSEKDIASLKQEYASLPNLAKQSAFDRMPEQVRDAIR